MAATSLAAPDVKGFFTEAGVEIVGSTPAEFDAYFREERDRWFVALIWLVAVSLGSRTNLRSSRGAAVETIAHALDERDPAKVLIRLRRRLARREAALADATPGSARHRDAAMDVAGLRVLIAAWESKIEAVT